MLIMLFTLANLADYTTTVVGISSGFQEINGLVASLDPLSFLILKLLVILSLSLLLVAAFRLREYNAIAKGIYIGLIFGAIISTAFVSLAAVHNAILLAGFPENDILIKIVSKILV